MGLSGRRSISHRVSPSRGPFFLAPLLPGAKSSGFLPSETSLIFLNCILKSCLMRLDQLKERWLAESTRKTKKKKGFTQNIFQSGHEVFQASKPYGIDPLDSTWRLGRGGRGAVFCLFQPGAQVSALNECMHKK